MTLAFIKKDESEGYRCSYYPSNGRIYLPGEFKAKPFLSFAKGGDGKIRIVMSNEEIDNVSFNVVKSHGKKKICYCRKVGDRIFNGKKTVFRLIPDGKFDDMDVYKISIDE